ncbi:MAG: 4Fe-4S binding protein [Planctomycetia bacterium]|nr:4Fe-4S binding protein [Planctomycetia bacterium]
MATDYATLKANGYMRQIQPDHFSMRLRVVGGHVDSTQLQRISEVAQKYGRGYVHLTSRQGIEIPFIRLEDIDAVQKELAEANVFLGAAGPRVRSITACQGGRCCPSGAIDAYDLACKLDARYFGRALPHKFKIGVTGCPNNCLKAEENDLGAKGAVETSWNADSCAFCSACQKCCKRKAIEVNRQDKTLTVDREKCNHCGRCASVCPKGAMVGKKGTLLSFGGTFGNNVVQGRAILPIIFDENVLFSVCDATVDYFEQNANRGERFAGTLQRLGWEPFVQVVQGAYDRSVNQTN